MNKHNLFAITLLLLSLQLKAEIVLPRILGHNMVLQQGKPVVIWGKASVGETVSVQFAGQNQTTYADGTGKWSVTLKPFKASAIPLELVISGTNTIRLQNILVGEVWLCSGQSNMEYTMRKNSKVKRSLATQFINDHSPVDELEYANNPQIRIFLVNRKELSKPDSLHRGWNVAQDSALRSFSAPAYFFAKELYKSLNVPIGVISSAIPGSRIEPWISEAAFREDAYYSNQKVDGEPGKFYEPMIRPLAPFALKGFLWYQGESNCFLNETITYSHKLKTLITSWRSAWNDPKLSVYYTQLVPFRYSESKGKVALTKETLPAFREAQEAVLSLPRTGMITTTDLADDLSDIHPPFKWEIGRRLALLALAADYEKPVVSEGPVYEKMKVRGRAIELHFSQIGTGLVSKDGQLLTDFTIAGADRVFVPAQASIDGKHILVSAPGVQRPVAVRFAWDEAAQPNLVNQEGLPARPFRTDNPLKKQLAETGKAGESTPFGRSAIRSSTSKSL
ncbi:sialate O-acetylesterase [Spirosoma sp. KCTC 42546]|uniref:sialate O-acetylesterase n=1 Tax=Spirosoma sp. KCTC 42546 TaxID=2520506 RepID=UPI001159AA40|nr:sialate O-acetylesterase [Spirosoma sp. KCTC 42546]QDK80652.1 sialate O-acetylesterase [Spirosoma sp. KCTC 42546]